MMVRTLPLLKAVATSRFFPGTVAVVGLSFLLDPRLAAHAMGLIVIAFSLPVVATFAVWGISSPDNRIKMPDRAAEMEAHNQKMADKLVPGRVPLAIVALALASSEPDRWLKGADLVVASQFDNTITLLLMIATTQTAIAAYAVSPIVCLAVFLRGGRP